MIKKNEKSRSAGQHRKERLKELLLKRNLTALAGLAHSERTTLRTLASLLFDRDKLVCWRAVEALGRAAAVEYEKDPEKVRELLRRLFWQLNDESGNLGWYAPQAIAAILAEVPSLIEEYGRVLVSFLPEEPFEGGVRWGLARIAAVNKDAFNDTVASQLLLRSLKEPDKDKLGFTLYALKALDIKVNRADVAAFQSDPHQLEIYNWQTGEFDKTMVAELAGDLLR